MLRTSVVILVLLLGSVPGLVQAGSQDGAVVAVSGNTKACRPCPVCENSIFPPTACADFTTSQPTLSGVLILIAVAKADPDSGIAGISFGIEANPTIGIFGWDLCGDQEFSTAGWPSNATGNTVTWNPNTNCQREVFGTEGVQAYTGALYIYAYGDGALTVTPNFAAGDSVLRVSDCNGAESALSAPGGAVGFGTTPGYTPCSPAVPVEQTTWGKIKSLRE